MKTLLITDGDCEFCQLSATWLRKHFNGDWVNQPSQTLELEKFGLTKTEVDKQLWFLIEDSNQISGWRKYGGGRGYLAAFPEDAQLFEYDVVFLGDVGVGPRGLSVQQCASLKQLVRTQAGGLVFLPGIQGNQNTLVNSELDELLPVVMNTSVPRGRGTTRPGRFALTEAGRRSLLTRLEADDVENEKIWNGLPGFYWYAAAERARAGAQVLATHDSESTAFGRVPLIAARTSGTGKVLYMGSDGAWRWRKGVEDLYRYRFWGQVVRWMAYQRNMSQGESMRLFFSPDRPEAGSAVTLNANVMKLSHVTSL